MDGSLYESGKFVYNLRLRLWNEIFGFICDDPINNEFWNNIFERSKVLFFFYKLIIFNILKI